MSKVESIKRWLVVTFFIWLILGSALSIVLRGSIESIRDEVMRDLISNASAEVEAELEACIEGDWSADNPLFLLMDWGFLGFCSVAALFACVKYDQVTGRIAELKAKLASASLARSEVLPLKGRHDDEQPLQIFTEEEVAAMGIHHDFPTDRHR